MKQRTTNTNAEFNQMNAGLEPGFDHLPTQAMDAIRPPNHSDHEITLRDPRPASERMSASNQMPETAASLVASDVRREVAEAKLHTTAQTARPQIFPRKEEEGSAVSAIVETLDGTAQSHAILPNDGHTNPQPQGVTNHTDMPNGLNGQAASHGQAPGDPSAFEQAKTNVVPSNVTSPLLLWRPHREKKITFAAMIWLITGAFHALGGLSVFFIDGVSVLAAAPTLLTAVGFIFAGRATLKGETQFLLLYAGLALVYFFSLAAIAGFMAAALILMAQIYPALWILVLGFIFWPWLILASSICALVGATKYRMWRDKLRFVPA